MTSPRFTFCIPNLNKRDYLPACIESMLSQDCPDWCCVFVDGYSTDGSWEYMQQFADDPRFRLLRGKRQGMYEDWTECLRYVETDYFYILTSDDTCSPELVSSTVTALDQFPDIEVCHFQFSLIDPQGMVVKTPEQIISHYYDLYAEIDQVAHRRSGLCEFVLHFVYRTLYTTITSLVFRRTLLPKLNGFKSQYGSIGDYDWTMRLGWYTDILYLPKPLATWRIYAEQATQLTPPIDTFELLIQLVQDNVAEFNQLPLARSLKQPLQLRHALIEFQLHHASLLYRQLAHAKTMPHAFQLAATAFSQYPLYGFKKLLNRVSQNRLYPYLPRHQLATQLIQLYGLDWPPTPVEVKD